MALEILPNFSKMLQSPAQHLHVLIFITFIVLTGFHYLNKISGMRNSWCKLNKKCMGTQDHFLYLYFLGQTYPQIGKSVKYFRILLEFLLTMPYHTAPRAVFSSPSLLRDSISSLRVPVFISCHYHYLPHHSNPKFISKKLSAVIIFPLTFFHHKYSKPTFLHSALIF